MKAKFLILLLTVFVTACSSITSDGDIRVFTYNGHEYLYHQRGGLMHSVSCPCNEPQPKLTEWQELEMAIAMTESEFNTDAVGSNNDSGILQITPVYVAEVNRLSGKDYRHSQSFDAATSVEMFNTLQSFKNPEKDIDKAIYYHNKSPFYKKKVMQNLAFIKRYEAFRLTLINYDND